MKRGKQGFNKVTQARFTCKSFVCVCHTLFCSVFLFNIEAMAQEVVENVGNLRPIMPEFVKQDKDKPFALPEIKPNSKSPGGSGHQTFLLQEIRFSGNSAFTDRELREETAQFIGKSVSASDLETIRFAITQFYIARGYINSGAILPSQNIKNGVVNFQIIEGHLDQINITGMENLEENYIKLRLLPDPNETFNLNTFQERYQLLLNDPMFDTFQGQFKPGTRPGESILDVKVRPASPFGLSLQADNYGSASSGEGQLSLHSYYLNPLGIGDSVAVSIKRREGATSGNIMYQLPLTYSDTRLTLQYGFNDSEVVEEQIDVLDIESEYKSTDISISHPFINSLTKSLVIAGTLSVRENEGRLLQLPFSFAPGENNGFSKVTALRLSAQGSIRSDEDVWSAHIRYSHGLKAFDATDNNNERPDSDFSSLLIQLQYARLFSDGIQFSWRADAQISSDGLLPLEQFAIGGANTVRGYRENELVRDEGFSTSVQVTSPVFDELDFAGKLGTLEAFVFSDYGDASFKNDVFSSSELWSAGVGVTWEFLPEWQLEAVYAHAFKEPQPRPNSVLQDDGIHVRVSGVLF